MTNNNTKWEPRSIHGLPTIRSCPAHRALWWGCNKVMERTQWTEMMSFVSWAMMQLRECVGQDSNLLPFICVYLTQDKCWENNCLVGGGLGSSVGEGEVGGGVTSLCFFMQGSSSQAMLVWGWQDLKATPGNPRPIWLQGLVVQHYSGQPWCWRPLGPTWRSWGVFYSQSMWQLFIPASQGLIPLLPHKYNPFCFKK